jgi:hypothetical protein
MSGRRQLGEALNNHAGSKPYFQDGIVRRDLEKAGDPNTAVRVHARHDDAAQPPNNAPRATPNMFGPEAIPGYLMMPSDVVRNGKS